MLSIKSGITARIIWMEKIIGYNFDVYFKLFVIEITNFKNVWLWLKTYTLIMYIIGYTDDVENLYLKRMFHSIMKQNVVIQHLLVVSVHDSIDFSAEGTLVFQIEKVCAAVETGSIQFTVRKMFILGCTACSSF